MQSLRIPCPQCGKELRLNDRKLLGRKGRCPKCEHRFVLEEPEEVLLEEAPEENPFAGIGQPASSPDVPPFINPAEQPTGDPAFNFDSTSSSSSSTLGTSRLREMKKRNAKRRNIALLAGTLILASVGGVVAFVLNQPPDTEKETSHKQKVATVTILPPKKTRVIKADSPTNGQPISLKFVPSGTRILINIRPAELWQDELQQKEFRACLGPLTLWAEETIKTLCLFEPTEIEELLIGLIPGVPGTPPDLTVVVHLKQAQQQSALTAKFQAQPNNDYGETVYVGNGRSYLIHDSKTFSIAPNGMEDDLVDAGEEGGVTSTGIEETLSQTDRKRHLTLVFEPYDGRIHHEAFAPEMAHPLLKQFFDWFGDEVEVAAWSLHLGKSFYSDLVLRNKPSSGTSPTRLKQLAKKKMEALPKELYEMARKMRPQQKGPQQIVGRFPAMMKVYSMATKADNANRYVSLTTELPERAAPNLALGALLTWDESTRTDFDAAPSMQPTRPQQPSLPIAEQLKKPIDIDFRRTPLQDAFTYIGEETGVTIFVDGDALKLSGYTKNMPQTYNLGMVPGTTALHSIIEKYGDMVLVIDDQKQLLTVMTKAVAKDRKLKTYDPAPEK